MKAKAAKMNLNELTVWGASELRQAGFSHSMAYQLLHRDDVPTLKIGNRLFVYREGFQAWLEQQACKSK